jgi:23S rRNA pseudouridine2605 synthase
MRDRPPRNTAPRLDWPGGVVPEWAKPAGNPNKRRRGGKGKGGGHGGHERQGGSSPSKRERLQKIMAQSGHGSRRNIEILIAQGHITINGVVAKLGDLVGPGDKVKMDEEFINLRFGDPLPRVLLYHKPEGEIVTRDDPEGRATVFEKLPKVHNGRWVSIGRLDINTGGLLMFTTSGELANRMMHPRFEVEREYAVRLMGELTEETRKQLLEGVDIEGEKCKFDLIEDRGGEGSNHWHHVVLREGKNREVRKMFDAVHLMVSRLMRVRFGSIAMPTFLKRGMMKEMEEADVAKLLEFAGIPLGGAQVAAPAPAQPEEVDEDAQPPGISHTQSTLGVITQGPGFGHGGGGNRQRGPRGAGQGQGQGAGQGQQKFGKQGKHRKHRKGGGQPGAGQGGQPQGQGGQPQGQGQPGGQGGRRQWQGKQGGQGGQGNKAGGGGRGKQRHRQRGDEQPRFPSDTPRFMGDDPPPPRADPATIHRTDEQPRFYVDMDRPPRGDQQPRPMAPKGRARSQRGDEQPRFKGPANKPPRGDEQPRFDDASEKKNERGDEQPLTNENRRIW